MNKQEKWIERLIRRFYGIEGVFDEYKQREADRIGNRAFIFLYLYVIFSTLIAFLVSLKFPNGALWGLLICNFIFIIYVISGYVLFASSKTNLTENELSSEEKDLFKQKAKRKSVTTAVYFSLCMYFFMALTDWITGTPATSAFLNISIIIGSCISGSLFAAAAYSITNERTKK